MASPYDYLAPTGMGDGSAIVQWLRSMIDQRRAQEPNAPYAGSYRGRLTPEAREGMGFDAQEPPAIQTQPQRRPDYMSGVTKTEPGTALASRGPGALVQDYTPEDPGQFRVAWGGGEPQDAPARTALQFAWGGGTPQDYRPGETDIYAQPGAPSMTQGFMPGGATRDALVNQDLPGVSGDVPLPVSQRQSAGGVGAAPWEDVANPIGMPGYEESIAQAMAERERKDPLWRERALTDEQVRANMEIMQGQSNIGQAAREKQVAQAVQSAKDSSLAQLAILPEYQRATPENKRLMEADASARAEAELLRAFGGARTSYDITPDLPRANFQRTAKP